MSIQFAKRAASQLMNRGLNSIRIKPTALDDAVKALTREDIRKMIQNGNIYAIKAKHNLSLNSKKLKQARSEGRRRGIGRRRGTDKARTGNQVWEKKVRSQRRVLKMLKEYGKIDTVTFNKFYGLIKGNSYDTKTQLISHLNEHGSKITEEDVKKMNERITAMYVTAKPQPQQQKTKPAK